MSKTRSKYSSNTLVTLSACGALFAVAGAALGQGVQGPNTFQGGTGGIPPGNLQTGKPAGAVDTFNKGPGTAGAVDTFNKGTTGAAGFIWFNKGGPNPAGAEPPPSPSKGAGANPAAMGNFEVKAIGEGQRAGRTARCGIPEEPVQGRPQGENRRHQGRESHRRRRPSLSARRRPQEQSEHQGGRVIGEKAGLSARRCPQEQRTSRGASHRRRRLAVMRYGQGVLAASESGYVHLVRSRGWPCWAGLLVQQF